MAKRSLGTEWFGFDGTEFHTPKSFGDENDPSWADAYRALFYLVGGLEISKNVETTELSFVTSKSKFFLEYILLKTVTDCAHKVNRNYRPTYSQKHEVLSKIRGKIDFSATVTQCWGAKHQFACTYHELKQDDPISIIIREGSNLVQRNMSKWLNDQNRQLLANSVKQINAALPPSEGPVKLERICSLLLSSNVNSERFGDLISEAKVLAHFILSNRVGFDGKNNAKLKTTGLMLNLNRIFERLLSESLVATGRFKKDSQKLNDIFLLREAGDVKSTFTMKPDCKGYLQFGNGERYVLLDAKHKIMSESISDPNESIDLGTEINRADLYQMISYSKTIQPRIHLTEKMQVALFGLNDESGSETNLITPVPSIFIDDGKLGIEVCRVAVNFGLMMKQLGAAIQTADSRTICLAKIGESLISGLEQAASYRAPAGDRKIS